MKLFEFDQHIGDWRVLVQSRDIQNGAIQSRHITDGAVTSDKIAKETIEGRNIAPDAVDGTKIKVRTLTGRNIAKGAIQSWHLEDESITGDEVDHDSVIPGKIANDAVQTRNIKDRNVTSAKIKKGAILLEHFTRETLDELHKDLQNQIDSLNEHGLSVSNEFGDNTHIGISQKTLTDAINKIWQKIEDMTGEVLQGINMTVSPDYFISEDGATLHITANTVETNGIFEKIQFFGNGQLIAEYEDTDYVEFDHHVDETTVVMCKAKILGIEYKRQNVVTHYNSFWMGAGNGYTDVMDLEHVVPISNGMRGAYDVRVGEDEHIIIVIGDTLRKGFIRADINGLEISFTESRVTIDEHEYCVLVSDGTYQAGTYNIDING